MEKEIYAERYNCFFHRSKQEKGRFRTFKKTNTN